MNKNWLAPAFIILLTCLFLVFWDSPPETFLPQKPETPKTSKHPSNIVHNAVRRRFDENGQLSSVFVASETRYYQKNPKRRTAKDYADLTAPKLTMYSVDKPPTTIVSNTGKARNNGNLVQLWGDVHITRTDTLGQSSELTTPYLVVKPERQYAETDKPVIITSPGNTTHAVGMEAYLKTDTIKLLSNVRGIHDPQ
ncbi:LPS export ABC transporter periplasmic protein LptC [Pseudomaricurvus sp.]|uniref:LPS export ABC transporter periplasmic protein LptC n=1 Tax=Pseudomaricurvus sp. TaxID=2004510 RepID=UPI003F6B9A6D